MGHSDADVLLHAICDALLGAAALGDIGIHFPDTSVEYKNMDSKILLQRTVSLIAKANFRIVNIDSTVCLERPKISPYMETMRNSIAVIAGIEVSCVSVKATTTEKMGFIGREEGLAAYATVLVENK
jgi:2-C-methyl-D-erythritol 2,4-cyclodiphosphate synthase